VSKHQRHPLGILLATAACALLLMSCSHSPSVQFYSLTPSAASTSADPLDLSLSIGPAQFPRALARSQIVTRAGGNQVKVDQYHVWSAPLEYEFLRVLGDNIAADVQSDRIAVYPATPAFQVDYRILLDVVQFDGVPGDSVTLRVRWAVAPPMGEAVAVGTFEKVQPTAGDDSYNALVAAHSAAIGELARTLTAKLRELGKPPAS
jgi:uncharacterized lipoprotein YmbA